LHVNTITEKKNKLIAQKTKDLSLERERERERERLTRDASGGGSGADITKLHFNLVQEGGCFVKRPFKIRFILHQQITVGFLQKNTRQIIKIQTP
jgi:hypothetical protein